MRKRTIISRLKLSMLPNAIIQQVYKEMFGVSDKDTLYGKGSEKWSTSVKKALSGVPEYWKRKQTTTINKKPMHCNVTRKYINCPPNKKNSCGAEIAGSVVVENEDGSEFKLYSIEAQPFTDIYEIDKWIVTCYLPVTSDEKFIANITTFERKIKVTGDSLTKIMLGLIFKAKMNLILVYSKNGFEHWEEVEDIS